MKPSLSQNQKASAKLTCEGGSVGEGEEGGEEGVEEGGEVEVDGEAEGVGGRIFGIQ